MQYPVRRAGPPPVIRDQLLHSVRTALDAVGFPEPTGGVALELAKQRDHGDWSTSVPLQVAKAAGGPPPDPPQPPATAPEGGRPPHPRRVQNPAPRPINFLPQPP